MHHLRVIPVVVLALSLTGCGHFGRIATEVQSSADSIDFSSAVAVVSVLDHAAVDMVSLRSEV